MSQESFIRNNIELQKKMLGDYKNKIEKYSGLIMKLAIVIIVLNVIFLFAIPFASVNGESVSMFDAFEYDSDEIGTLKFFYFVSWAATLAIAVASFLANKKKEDSYAWIKPHLAVGVVNLVCSVILLLVHMTAETEMLYGTSTCFLWWAITAIAAFIYIIIPIMGFVYQKYIPVLEKNVNEFEKE